MRLIERDTLRARIGKSYARIARRKTLEHLTGLSTTAVHARVHGDTAIRVEEIARIGRSTDPNVNPHHVAAELMVAVEGQRRHLGVVELAISLNHGLRAESHTDGLEDVTQDELREVLWALLIREPAAMNLPERVKVCERLASHRDSVTHEIANLLRVAGDIEAILDKLAPVEEVA